MKALIGRIPKVALAGLALVVVAAVAVAAYAATDGGSSSSTASGPDQAAMQEFQQCLSEHGVPAAPGPAGPPPGVDPDKWNEAMQTCSSLAPGPAG